MNGLVSSSVNQNNGNGPKNRGVIGRTNVPGQGYRSTGRNNLGISTPGGQNGHPIFLNAELKHVLTNNTRKTRGNNSLTMPLATGSNTIGGTSNLNINKVNNTSYNLRTSGHSPTNFNNNVGGNNHKLVRYKNSNSRTIASPVGQMSPSNN